ncbi:efflux transporter outer membrane subunit [Methylomarinum vadi]|uniref:efflux transporter outer membrane subunit n=1 Tax=Methylomarinum vadi TaxID=438855 RepID=UPI000A076D3D|nr:efflux transporter outer membrane subunit [Methylomarinum vadi]
MKRFATSKAIGARRSVQYGRLAAAMLLGLSLTACVNGPAFDLAPSYQPPQFVVPDSWQGTSPFVKAEPADNKLRKDWWRVFNDPVLNRLETEAVATNPDLQAAAERFVQARDVMMKVRSRLLPQIGLEFNASNNKASEHTLFRSEDDPIHDSSVSSGGIASWEPDFWSAIRNETRAETYRAQQRAADYALARLSLQAEIADTYFTLRGYDAQSAIYRRSIAYYQKSMEIIKTQFEGAIASAVDVARAQYLLSSTQSKALKIQASRQVTEHALAILVNRAPAGFHIEPVDRLQLVDFNVPKTLPARLLERRPDIAAMEREMAEANRVIGIARAAFFPNVSFNFGGGYESNGFDLIIHHKV